jgi:molybdate transport system substrate-binding protein
MTRRSLLVSLTFVLVAALGIAPRPAAAEGSGLGVVAAASLTESLQKVGAAWTAKGHPAVTFSFDSSSKVAKQVEAGVPADVFVSADLEWMDYLDGKGFIEKPTRRNLLGNSLVAILPVASPLPVTAAADLARPEIQHLALAGENVPAGKYARAALTSLGAWEGVKARVVSGDNVRTVLGWVATGEADAGVVYATDAKVEPRVKVAFTFPATSYSPIVYPAAAVKGAPHAKDAADFVAYCASPDGMAVFLAAGFTPAPKP